MRRLVLAALAAFALAVPAAAFAQAAPSAYTAAVRYDNMNRVVGTIAPDTDGVSPFSYVATRTTYDADGRVTRVETGALTSWQPDNVLPSAWPVWNPTTGTGFQIFSQVDTSYDGLDRKVIDLASSGGTPYRVTQYSYDAVGRPDCAAVRMNSALFPAVPATPGAIVLGSLPSSACLLGTQGSQGPDRISRNVYDDAGQVLRVEKAYGVTAANGFAQTLQQDYVTYTYSGNGKPLTVKDADGNVAGYTYDGFDRLAKWSFPDKASIGTISTTDYESYGYDANGNRTSLRKRDGRTFTYTYDNLDRVTVKAVPDACVPGYACTTPPANAVRDVYYGYDARGQQLYARFDSATGADAVTDVWDGFGRLTSETVAMGGTSRTVGYQYDADGNRIRLTYPDSAYFTYAFDGLDRISGVSLSGTTAVAAMTYDVQARPLSETRSNVTTTFGYDAISRLASLADDLPGTTGDVTSTLAYNPASQVASKIRSNNLYAFPGYVSVSRAYTANGLNQYSTAGSATFGYDSNGNLVSDGTSGFTYDAENRLVATASGATLTYDPMGRLYAVTSGGATESYAYAGDQRIGEYNITGSMTGRYVFGDGEDNPLIWYDGAATTSPRALQGDAQGSIVSVVDSSGTILAYNSYDEYGIPGASNLGRFQYTGQVWLPQIGLYYYKARIYSPTLGRFLQTDPIGYADQNDLYSYAGNDPVDGSDSTGLETDTTPHSGPNCPGATGSISCHGSGSSGMDGIWTKGASANQTRTGASTSTPGSSSNNGNSGGSDSGGYYVGLNGMRQKGPPPEIIPMDDTRIGLEMAQDEAAVAAGRMPVREMRERQVARFNGALTGLTVLDGGLAVGGALKLSARIFAGEVTRQDIIRFGPTVVSNQVLRGRGEVGAGVRNTIKGGGGPFAWKFHIGLYNWYKPWTWFKNTPIIKP